MTSFKENVTAPYIEDNLTNTSVQVLSDLIEERFAAYNSGALFAQKVRSQRKRHWLLFFACFSPRGLTEKTTCKYFVKNVPKNITMPIFDFNFLKNHSAVEFLSGTAASFACMISKFQ